jgi:hypothetical protein
MATERTFLLCYRRWLGISWGLMIKVLLLVFYPAVTWQRIVESRRSIIYILGVFLLPLLVLTSLGEGYGLVTWGKVQSNVHYVRKFLVPETVVFELAQILASLLIVFIGAKIIKSLGETFHGRHTYRQTFTVVAYGMGPIFTLRLMNMFPGLPPWVPWLASACLTLSVLYSGVPRVMDPDPPHAFGLFMTSSLLLLMISGLLAFVTSWFLRGKFPYMDELLTNLGRHLSSQ